MVSVVPSYAAYVAVHRGKVDLLGGEISALYLFLLNV